MNYTDYFEEPEGVYGDDQIKNDLYEHMKHFVHNYGINEFMKIVSDVCVCNKLFEILEDLCNGTNITEEHRQKVENQREQLGIICTDFNNLATKLSEV